ncbi:hydroxyacid dehydrogenase [Arthrobacter sp. BE255]|uniref:hydroxyacid dehydrogenase n=1 Tax=Arthrobacter sp. BE255 TaxID=2817721 RepID=UPI00285E3B91|nr:hydroxyacid dehydrogenase [Arthrobacter sp. BE255]MDR7161591.1 phosphoglycerate dehydrogenase-like enzyme [Arthrobacter sp. BE255]
MFRPKVAFALRSEELRGQLFPLDVLQRLRSVADIVHEPVLTDFNSETSLRVLSEVDALITGWGVPTIDARILDAAPQLQLIAHSAGTIKQHVDPACWDRGITFTTAAQANAVPVAEFTLAFILLAGKQTFAAASQLRRLQERGQPTILSASLGNLGSTVGIIGASRIGRLVLERLKAFDHKILLADPTVSESEASELGATLVSLDDLMARADVVSLHAPLLPTTVGMIGAFQLGLMKDGATFINTARGPLVDHEALSGELVTGRISAVLDVTDPEPLPAGDVLYGRDNVILTPHIAGSMGNELQRMGAAAVEEVIRLAEGRPYLHAVHYSELEAMA